MGGFFILILVLGSIVAFQAYKRHLADEARRTYEAAKVAYQRSLGDLKSDPTNTQLREQTLRLGRHYSNLGRNSQGETVFDEMAIMNDIGAAVGSAATLIQPPQSAATSPPSDHAAVEERLRRIKALREKNIISETEYEAQRAAIIGSL
jgi:hypothetical protein